MANLAALHATVFSLSAKKPEGADNHPPPPAVRGIYVVFYFGVQAANLEDRKGHFCFSTEEITLENLYYINEIPHSKYCRQIWTDGTGGKVFTDQISICVASFQWMELIFMLDPTGGSLRDEKKIE